MSTLHQRSLRLLPAAGLLPSAAVRAAAEGQPGAALVQGQLVQTVLGLAVVVVLIFGLAWLLRQVFRLQPTMNGQLRILGGLSLGPRERVVLVKVGDTQLVVGTAPGRIQTLHVMDKPIPEDLAPAGADGGGFARALAQALGRRGTAGGDRG